MKFNTDVSHNIEYCCKHAADFLARTNVLNATLTTKAFGQGSKVDNDNTLGNTNETESELSSLSHVDAPNDVLYMVGGVVIAMILVAVIIVLVAVTINKLRKREESLSASPPSIEAQQMNFGSPNRSSSASITCESHQQDQQLFTTSSSGQCSNGSNNSMSDQEQITFTRTSGGTSNSNGWVFPPKAPTPKFYNCNINDALGAQNDKNGFKGFRKQFSGRFKRLLVTKKTEPIPPAIPPELKPQLKTIYVY